MYYELPPKDRHTSNRQINARRKDALRMVLFPAFFVHFNLFTRFSLFHRPSFSLCWCCVFGHAVCDACVPLCAPSIDRHCVGANLFFRRRTELGHSGQCRDALFDALQQPRQSVCAIAHQLSLLTRRTNSNIDHKLSNKRTHGAMLFLFSGTHHEHSNF